MSNQIVFKGLQFVPAVFLSKDVVSILWIASKIVLKLFQSRERLLDRLIMGVVVGGMMKVAVKDQGLLQGDSGKNQLRKISRGIVVIDYRGGSPIGE